MILTTPPCTAIHGLMDRHTLVPTALEVDGKLRRVVRHRYRWDLRVPALEEGRWLEYWQVELETGARMVVVRDQEHGGPWQLVDASAEVDSSAPSWQHVEWRKPGDW